MFPFPAVIPNRAEHPVRACPELAEGNLLFVSPVTAASSEKEIKARETKNQENEAAAARPRGICRKPHKVVTLSEVSASRSEALTQSKGPYCSSTADPLQGISLGALNIVRMPFSGPLPSQRVRDPSTPFASRFARDKFRSG